MGSDLTSRFIIVILLLAGGAYYVQNQNYNSPRPESTNEYQGAHNHSKIRARLWEDPFAALGRNRNNIIQNTEDGSGDFDFPAIDSDKIMCDDIIPNIKENTLILGIMIPGGPYFNDAESRLRYRGAALSALLRTGFIPYDTNHLSCLNTNLFGMDALVYERFHLDPIQKNDSDVRDDIVLIWLDQEDFYFQPLDKLYYISRRFTKKNEDGQLEPFTPNSISVLGPSDSTGLKSILGCNQHEPTRKPNIHIEFYSFAITLSSDILKNTLYSNCNTSNKSGTDDFDTHGDPFSRSYTNISDTIGFSIHRTIGTDDLLVQELTEELVRRGISDGDTIAIVSEWDTENGRAMKRYFAPYCNDISKHPHFDCHYIHYMAGLDGELGGTSGREPGTENKDSEKTSAMGENAEGIKQFDYLQRAADDLWLDQMYSRTPVRAIGVLGNDIYDKLVVLQAFRPLFPDTLFFTTNIDERFRNTENIKFAKRLVIASNYGLRLKKNILGETPPFRDTFQTSLFLSTVTSIHDWKYNGKANHVKPKTLKKIHDLTTSARKTPLLHELGGFHFASLPANNIRWGDPICNVTWISGCSRQRFFSLQFWMKVFMSSLHIAIIVSLLVAFLFFIDENFVDFLWRLSSPKRVLIFLSGVILTLLILSILWNFFLIDILTDFGQGSSLAYFQGISIWPTISYRTAAMIAAMGLLYKAWHRLERKNIDIINLLNTSDSFSVQTHPTPWINRSYFYLNRIFPKTGEEETPHKKNHFIKDVSNFWLNLKQYYYHDWLVFIMVGLFLTVAIYLFMDGTYFNLFYKPVRGSTARFLYRLTTILSIFSLQFIVFYTAGSIYFWSFFLGRAKGKPMNGNNPFVKEKKNIPGLSEESVNALGGLAFVEKQTAYTFHIIYYPFVVLTFMFLSETPKSWNDPGPLEIIYTMDMILLTGGAMLLNQRIIKFRDYTLKILQQNLLSAGEENPDHGKHIENEIECVNNLDAVAFNSLLRQPFIRAILIPVLGVLATMSAEYANLFNWFTSAMGEH